MHILFLSSWFPYPADNGSKLRVYNLLRGMAQTHEITLLSFCDSDCMNTNPAELRSLCKEIIAVPREVFKPEGLKAWLDFFSRTPRFYKETTSPEIAHRIQKIITTGDIDLVIASQVSAASYSDSFGNIPSLFEEVELGVPYEQFLYASPGWRRFRNGLTWFKHRHYIQRLLSNFRACTVVSERERQLLAHASPDFDAVEVIPNCINLNDYRQVNCLPEPHSLIFTGSFRYDANYDAMVWFIKEILPLIQAEIPGVRLTITGDSCAKPLPRAENIHQTGYVRDVHSLVASSWISLAPLRIGGGTRLKILEAMALGTPVVATSKGAEGLMVQAGKHLLIADEPKEMAEVILGLLKDREQRRQLTSNAQRLVSEHYDWAVVMPRFLSLLEKVSRV